MDGEGLERATHVLHRLTSLDGERDWDQPADDPRVLQDFKTNDPDRRTWFTKRYDGALPRTPLPRELPVNALPALAVLAGTARPEPKPLDLAGLSRVLHLSAGVTRKSPRPYGMYLFRAAGSAGGRFPLELYVAVPEGAAPRAVSAEVPPGVHWYDPVEHALVRVGPPPRPDRATPPAPTLVVTGIPWRTGWRYAERGFRHVYWDAGTMLSQLLALTQSAGYAPRLYSRFPDAEVSALVGADRVHEWPVALVALGDAAPSTAATEHAVAGPVDAAALEFPLVTAAQRAGDLDVLGEAWPQGAAARLATEESPSIDEVIARRGSQRRMDPERGVPLETLRTSMAVALRGIDIEHWVAVHDVAGVAPGVYRWPDLDRPVWSAGADELRAQLYRVCLDQSLARDAAFVAIAAAEVARLSDREYREAQLGAGIVEGRLHLAAYALGAGATGMTFLDAEIPALLNGPRQQGGGTPWDGLIFTCVGVPGNSSKPAGLPGAPVEVRQVRPRE